MDPKTDSEVTEKYSVTSSRKIFLMRLTSTVYVPVFVLIFVRRSEKSRCGLLKISSYSHPINPCCVPRHRCVFINSSQVDTCLDQFFVKIRFDRSTVYQLNTSHFLRPNLYTHDLESFSESKLLFVRRSVMRRKRLMKDTLYL